MRFESAADFVYNIDGGRAMTEATFVNFVPLEKCVKLRTVLETENTAPLSWREEGMLFGSEFYFFGPEDLARRTHDYIKRWVGDA